MNYNNYVNYNNEFHMHVLKSHSIFDATGAPPTDNSFFQSKKETASVEILRATQNEDWNTIELPKLMKNVCGKCGKEFDNEPLFTQHIDHHHKEMARIENLHMQLLPEKGAECLICGFLLQENTLLDMQIHHLQHLQNKTHRCKCHGYYFSDKDDCIKHLEYFRKTQLTEGKAISLTWPGMVHRNILPCKKTAPLISLNGQVFPETCVHYKCPECAFEFDNEEIWKRHLTEAHDQNSVEGLNMTRTDDGVTCNVCSYSMPGRPDICKLRRHRLTHSTFKSFYCCICRFERKRKCDVLAHVKKQHKPNV